MVNNSDKHLDNIFQALSDPTRRAMISRLLKGECTVSELPNPFRVSKAAISKHLNILHRAKLVEKLKDGRITRCSTKPESLDPVLDVLEELGDFWSERLDSLANYFSKDFSKEKKDERIKQPKPKVGN